MLCQERLGREKLALLNEGHFRKRPELPQIIDRYMTTLDVD